MEAGIGNINKTKNEKKLLTIFFKNTRQKKNIEKQKYASNKRRKHKHTKNTTSPLIHVFFQSDCAITNESPSLFSVSNNSNRFKRMNKHNNSIRLCSNDFKDF